ASRELPSSDDPARAGLDAFALAVAKCEDVLFGTGTGADAIAFDLLAERRLAWSDAGEAGRLSGAVPASGTGTRPRRLHSAFIRERLRRASAGQVLAVPPMRSLWLAWRAARGRR